MKRENIRRTSDFRESISLKLSFFEKKLEECVKVKDTYTNFLYLYINVVEIASYALCVILSSTKSMKETWKKGMDSLKTIFDGCMKINSA